MSSDALAAKCRSMKGRLLTKDQYYLLASRSGFADAVGYLKTTEAYSSVLNDVDPMKIHRARFEQLLEKNLLSAYSKLYTFTSGNERKFFALLLEEFTINFLLDAIRATEYDDTMDFYHIPRFIREHTNIDFSRIFKTNSKEEILEILKGTEYYDVLKTALSNSSSFEFIEFELIRAYYRKLMKNVTALFVGEEQKDILDALHMKIDIMNISVILRMRRFNALRGQSDTSPLELTEVFLKLIPIFGRLKESDISALCAENLSVSDTIERFSNIVRRPSYELDEKTSTGEYGSKMLFSKSKKLSGKNSTAAALAYLTLLKTETDNLIYTFEALRYELPSEKICEKLIV